METLPGSLSHPSGRSKEIRLVVGGFAAGSAVKGSRYKGGKVVLRLTARCLGQVSMSSAALW